MESYAGEIMHEGIETPFESVMQNLYRQLWGDKTL